MQFTSMNLFHVALWQLMISIVTGRKFFPINATGLPESLTLELKLNGIVTTIQLKYINRVLANKFLPVWITTDIPGVPFTKLNIMGELGEFMTYYDSCTKSAFVYFHKRHELSGIINVRYYVKEYPIDETGKVHIVKSKYLHRIKRDQPHTRVLRQSTANTTLCRERRHSKQNMYPELLVAISHDTYTAIEQDSKFPRGIATISHILTVYNAADMLYKPVLSANIQLNIAGIVIEGEPNQWHFESKDSNSEFFIDADVVHPKISDYFWFYQYHFPKHSYDVIMYHTRHPVIDDSDDTILGQSTQKMDGYMFPLHYREDRLNAVIRDFETYEHSITIAHELAHVFGAAHDGEGAHGYLFDTSCEDSLMSEFRGCSESCFKWSQQTETEFAAFLRAPAYCNMKNYPRSLDVPKPKIIFSESEQCECFGHQPKLWISSPPGMKFVQNRCNKPLTCASEYHEELEAPLPMDGTPCGSKRVCWNEVCVQYPNVVYYI